MKRKLFILLSMLISLISYAQVEYNPESPGDPAPYFRITTQASPSPVAYVSCDHGEKALAGEEIRVWFYQYNSDYKFDHWVLNGNRVSDLEEFTFEMPERSVTVTAVFVYAPISPDEPGEPILSHIVKLSCNPKNVGEFYVTKENNCDFGGNYYGGQAEFRLFEGQKASFMAYNRSSYKFVEWQKDGLFYSKDQEITVTMDKENLNFVAVYEYDPSSPENPGRNMFNVATGEVIIDDFQRGNLEWVLNELLGDYTKEAIQSLTVIGETDVWPDWCIFSYLSNCTKIDLSRTSGCQFVPGWAFEGDQSLTELLLPASILSIEGNSFQGCMNLSKITIYALQPPSIDIYTLNDLDSGCVIFVPAQSVDKYKSAEGWSNFTILPIDGNVFAITSSLPDDAKDGRYKGGSIELVNELTKVGTRNILTDATDYTFPYLTDSYTYTVIVRNANDEVLGTIEGIAYTDGDVTVKFSSLLQARNITISVLDDSNNDVTDNVTITWLNAEGNTLKVGKSITALEGKSVIYNITLPQELAILYPAPETASIVVSQNKNIELKLKEHNKRLLTGRLIDQDNKPVKGSVSYSQSINGKYSNSSLVSTEADGTFSIKMNNLLTMLSMNAAGYITSTIELGDQRGDIDLGDVCLEKITGPSIYLSHTYQECAEDNNEASPSPWVGEDIWYIVRDAKGTEIEDWVLQNGTIILPSDFEVGQDIEITAYSKSNQFPDVKLPISVLAASQYVTIPVVDNGALYAKATNASNKMALLYDQTGNLHSKAGYSNGEVNFKHLPDGQYTLISIGKSDLFNSLLNIKSLDESELAETIDYIENKVQINHGVIRTVEVGEVPNLDETKLYYTSNADTYFTSNKVSATVGNYVTLKAKITLKDEYVGQVGSATLVVEIPENCELVSKSVISGAGYLSYQTSKTRVIIPLNDLNSSVRLCIMPTNGGECKPTAYAQLTVNGKQVLQPIGSVFFEAKNMSLQAPDKTCSTTIVVRGNATADSEISIFDGDNLVGTTYSTSNGEWATRVPLVDTYACSLHEIYGMITTPENKKFPTETCVVEYNKDFSELSKISMIYGNQKYVFDFLKGRSSATSYIYNEPYFTYKAEFTNSNINLLSNVIIKVLVVDGFVREMPATYSPVAGGFVVNGRFKSTKAPTNVTATYDCDYVSWYDKSRMEVELENLYWVIQQKFDKLKALPYSVVEECDEYLPVLFNLDEQKFYLTIKDVDYNQYFGNTDENVETYTVGNTTYYVTSYSIEDDNLFAVIIGDGSSATMLLVEMLDSSVATPLAPKSIVQISQDLSNYIAKGKPQDGKIRDGIFHDCNEKNASKFLGFFGVDKDCKMEEQAHWRRFHKRKVKQYDEYWRRLLRSLNVTCNGNFLISDRDGLMKEIEEWHNHYSDMEPDFNNQIKGWRGNVMEGNATNFVLAGALNLLNSGHDHHGKHLKALCEDWASNIKPNAGKYQFDKGLPGHYLPSDCGEKMWTWHKGKHKDIKDKYQELYQTIIGKYVECIPDEELEDGTEVDDETDGNVTDKEDIITWVCPPIPPVIDPSGYVYEAVPSNRLEGVTATAYYQEKVTDIYGEVIESKAVLWDAEAYEQVNPQLTNAEGMYGWDVPAGNWQVKFEKAGYEPQATPWLPVPPPQLDVNINMTQNKAPVVKNVHAYPEYVEIEFDKFMQSSSLERSNIYLSQDNKNVNGYIEQINPELDYVSKIKYIPNTELAEGEATIWISANVLSYASIAMGTDYSQTFVVEPRIEEIFLDSELTINCAGATTIQAQVLSAKAAQGKNIVVSIDAADLATVSKSIVQPDEKGYATFTVMGVMPGVTTLRISVQGYDIESRAKLTVVEDAASILMGDVDASGDVTVTDAVKLVDYILGKEPEGFKIEAANVNGDKEISVADVVCIVDIVLGKSDNVSKAASTLYTESNLWMEAVTLQPGVVETMPVTLNSDRDFTAMQFDITLPEGIVMTSADGATLCNNHAVAWNAISANKYRVIVYSLNNDLFGSREGEVVMLSLMAQHSDAAGEIVINNGAGVTSNGLSYTLPESRTSAGISGLGLGIADNLQLSLDGRMLHINAPTEMSLSISTVGGVNTRLSLKAGENIYTFSAPGVYIVGNRKIIVK